MNPTTTMLVQQQPIEASELVEIPVANGASSAVIPDQPQLRNQGGEKIVITAIRLITDKVLAFAPTLGTATTPLADLKNMALILYSDGWEKGHNIPVLSLNDVNDSDSTAATTIPFVNSLPSFGNWNDIDWNKSKLVFASGQVASQASACIFQVEYLRIRTK